MALREQLCNIVGGVISPVLSNVFLHYVLDDWFEREVQPRLKGRAFLIRYADDAVIGFTDERDARRVLDVLPKRFGRYGLRLHPAKTRLIPFRRPPARGTDKGVPPGSGTFDLLGFTHYWGLSRKGHWVVKRKTAPRRFTRAVRSIARWCRLNRHRPVAQRTRDLRNRMRQSRTYGSVGTLGEQSPRVTRPRIRPIP